MENSVPVFVKKVVSDHEKYARKMIFIKKKNQENLFMFLLELFNFVNN